MEEGKTHSTLGTISLIFAILSIGCIASIFLIMMLNIGGMTFAALSIITASCFIFNLLAIILGAIAYFGKEKDTYGLVALILGIVLLLIGISVAVAATVYTYVTNVIPGPPTWQTTPDILWTVNQDTNELQIIQGDYSNSYAASSTSANLVFMTQGTSYYIQNDLSLTTLEQGLETGPITTGDIITGFQNDTTYLAVWIPTDTTIGTIIFI